MARSSLHVVAVANDRYPVSTTRATFSISVFRWPRRTFVKRIGFPGRARSRCLPPGVFACCSPVLRFLLPAAMHSFVNLLLQRLCRQCPQSLVYGDSCAAHSAGPLSAAHVDSDSTRDGFAHRHAMTSRYASPARKPRSELPPPAVAFCGAPPVKYADASAPEVARRPHGARCVASLRRSPLTTPASSRDRRVTTCGAMWYTAQTRGLTNRLFAFGNGNQASREANNCF